jgi:hypothetical protein
LIEAENIEFAADVGKLTGLPDDEVNVIFNQPLNKLSDAAAKPIQQ